jgi:hypothetical protein
MIAINLGKPKESCGIGKTSSHRKIKLKLINGCRIKRRLLSHLLRPYAEET